MLMALAAAGPAWRPAPSPFVTETAPLVVALDLSPSMTETDVEPSRLERAKQKVRDLIVLRAGGRVGLVATVTALVPSYMPEPPDWPDLQIADAVTRLPERATHPLERARYGRADAPPAEADLRGRLLEAVEAARGGVRQAGGLPRLNPPAAR
jgi:hypothetical protein